MKTVIGLNNLKDEFRKAKIQCGDLRGLKNKFELSERFGINPMQTYFFATSSNGGERYELVVEGDVNSYTLKELIQDVKGLNKPIEISFVCLTWNKLRTDAKRKTIIEITYSNN